MSMFNVCAKSLSWLIKSDQLDEMKFRLEGYSIYDLNLIVSQKYKHNSLLFTAVKHRRFSFVKYFLNSCGADPNDDGIYDDETYSCLHLAAAQNNPEIIYQLLLHGADMDHTDLHERTALYVATLYNNYKAVKCLVTNGVDINKPDYNGTTCLMLATSNTKIFRFLISHGAEHSLTDNSGQTALMIAVQKKKMSVVTELIRRRANLYSKNTEGMTASALAALEERWDIFVVLRRSGMMMSNTDKAAVYEISCCQRAIRGHSTESIQLWKKAVKLRNLATHTPLLATNGPPGFPPGLSWIEENLDYMTARVLVFMISRFGLLNPYTLSLLSESMELLEPTPYINLYRFFLKSLEDANNVLFEKSFSHVKYLTIRGIDGFEPSYVFMETIFKTFVDFIAHLFKRIGSSCPKPDEDRYALVRQMRTVYKTFIMIISKIDEEFPSRLYGLLDGFETIAKLDNNGPHDFSLLRLCVENDYPYRIIEILIESGFNTMRTDERGETALHYALRSFYHRQQNIVRLFLDRGFQPNRFTQGACLPCTLKKKNFLRTPVRFTTLKCLAATAVCSSTCLPYTNRLDKTIRKIIASHF